jgi:V/A-type H+/Na+-transporting ATPase subunit E
MALADLLEAIEADAQAERAREERDAAAEATAVVERARQEAASLEAELAAAPEASAHGEAADARALARVQAAGAVRAAREQAFASLLDDVRAGLAALRATERYPALFRALVVECGAALPAGRTLRVDARDVDLAIGLGTGLRVEVTLDTWGGVELTSDDGRTIRNTLEERLANAEPLLRLRFAHRLATGVQTGVVATP